MKRFSMYVLSLVISGALFVACDDDDDNDKLTLDKNNIEMFIGKSEVVKVKGGQSPYKATPADEKVVKATVKDAEITLEALKEGTTTVKVADKDGLETSIAVKVVIDPLAKEKDDATVRVDWDTFKKKVGDDKVGTFSLTKKAEDKTVTFTWKSEDDSESLIISFKDVNDAIGAKEATPKAALAAAIGKVVVKKKDQKDVEYDVTSVRVAYAQPADDKEGTPDTYWVAFEANKKAGFFVSPLTVAEPETPAQ